MKKSLILLMILAISISMAVTYSLAGCKIATATETTAAAAVTTAAAETTAAAAVTTAAAETTANAAAAQGSSTNPIKGLLSNIKGKQIHVIYLSNETMSTWQSVSNIFLKSLVERAGGICDVFTANSDAQKQAQQYEDAIVAKPDIIVTKPVDSTAIIPAVQKVNAANIPILSIDVKPDGGTLLTHIQTSQTDLGKLNAAFIGQYFKKLGVKALVISINGQTEASNSQERQKGFNDEAKSQGNITIQYEAKDDWDNVKAMNSTLDLMQKYPQTNAINCQSDAMLQGITQALKQLGKLYPAGDPKHIVICSIDGANNAIAMIKDGTIDHDSEHNSALHADIAVKVIIDYFHGYTIPNPIIFPAFDITKDNATDPMRWGNLDVKDVANWPVMNQDRYVMQTPPAQ